MFIQNALRMTATIFGVRVLVSTREAHPERVQRGRLSLKRHRGDDRESRPARRAGRQRILQPPTRLVTNVVETLTTHHDIRRHLSTQRSGFCRRLNLKASVRRLDARNDFRLPSLHDRLFRKNRSELRLKRRDIVVLTVDFDLDTTQPIPNSPRDSQSFRQSRDRRPNAEALDSPLQNDASCDSHEVVSRVFRRAGRRQPPG